MRVYDESANLTEIYTNDFDINEPSKLTEMVPVTGMGGTHLPAFVTHEIIWRRIYVTLLSPILLW